MDPNQVSAVRLSFLSSEMFLTLSDGRVLKLPLSLFPTLLHATPEARNQFEWIGKGSGIHWPALDEDLSVAGLLKTAETERIANHE